MSCQYMSKIRNTTSSEIFDNNVNKVNTNTISKTLKISNNKDKKVYTYFNDNRLNHMVQEF